MARHDALELVVLVYGVLEEFIRRFRDAADDIGLFDTAALEGQQHLIAHLGQEVVPPFAAAGGHGHARPLELVGLLVARGDGHAHAAVHRVRAGVRAARSGAVGIEVFGDDAHHHAPYPVVAGFGLCDLTAGDLVDDVVKPHDSSLPYTPPESDALSVVLSCEVQPVMWVLKPPSLVKS